MQVARRLDRSAREGTGAVGRHDRTFARNERMLVPGRDRRLGGWLAFRAAPMAETAARSNSELRALLGLATSNTLLARAQDPTALWPEGYRETPTAPLGLAELCLPSRSRGRSRPPRPAVLKPKRTHDVVEGYDRPVTSSIASRYREGNYTQMTVDPVRTSRLSSASTRARASRPVYGQKPL